MCKLLLVGNTNMYSIFVPDYDVFLFMYVVYFGCQAVISWFRNVWKFVIAICAVKNR